MAKQLSSLNVGDTIEIPGNPKYQSYWSNSKVWKVADKNHPGYPANSVTLIMSNLWKAIVFDAKEPNNTNGKRQVGGNDRYIYSNIHQWLNSDAEPGKWYTPKHSVDTPPTKEYSIDDVNLYYNWAGALEIMGANFVAALLPTTLTAARASVDGGGLDTFTAKLFLPSATELNITQNGIAEGSRLELFSDNASRVAYTNGNSNAYIWRTRTTVAGNASYVFSVENNGICYQGYQAYGRVYIRPVGNLPGDMYISDQKNANGNYDFYGANPPLSTYKNLIVGRPIVTGYRKP